MKTNRFLSEGAARLLNASDEERIVYIQRDRFFRHQAVEGIWEMMLGFVQRPVTQRPPCLAISGDSGSGKTSLLDGFNKEMEELDFGKSTRTCVSISTPSPGSIGVLQTGLMAALGIPRFASPTQHQREADIIIANAMLELGVRILLIDEIQHLDCKTKLHLRVCWDWIKGISTNSRVSVVCAGVIGYERHLHHDQQLKTRFTLVTLPRWQPGPALAEFLSAFERTLPLRKPSKLDTLEVQKCVIEETFALESVAGIMGGIKRVLEFAAIHAIRTGEERITIPGLSAWRGNLFV